MAAEAPIRLADWIEHYRSAWENADVDEILSIVSLYSTRL